MNAPISVTGGELTSFGHDEALLSNVRDILFRIQIGEPFKSWGMELSVLDNGQSMGNYGLGRYVRLRIVVKSIPHRNTGEPTEFWFTHVQTALHTLRTEREVMDLVRCALRSYVEHEVDEALYLDGERTFDPHEEQDWKIKTHKCSIE